jgi:RNA polymerase sigma-70 factor (sigma-E family)
VDFAEYVKDRHQALCRFAGVLSGSPALADDLVADVLGNAYERWPRIGGLENPHAYVRKMVVNEYLSWRRRAARTAVRPEMHELVEPVADHADAHADRHRLLGELRQLPPKQRAALVLRYYEGLPFSDIAELLGCGENAVRSNVSRALHRLRIQLTDEPADAGFPVTPIVAEVPR